MGSPFVRHSVFKDVCTFTNDLNPEIKATHVDALEFLQSLEGREFDGALFDPPFSPTQVKRAYDSVGAKLLAEHTQSSFYSKRKNAALRLSSQAKLFVVAGIPTALEKAEVLSLRECLWCPITAVIGMTQLSQLKRSVISKKLTI